jgi:hypothetical protein
LGTLPPDERAAETDSPASGEIGGGKDTGTKTSMDIFFSRIEIHRWWVVTYIYVCICQFFSICKMNELIKKFFYT